MLNNICSLPLIENEYKFEQLNQSVLAYAEKTVNERHWNVIEYLDNEKEKWTACSIHDIFTGGFITLEWIKFIRNQISEYVLNSTNTVSHTINTILNLNEADELYDEQEIEKYFEHDQSNLMKF